MKKFKNTVCKYALNNDQLYYKKKGKFLIIAKLNERRQLITDTHETYGHFGIKTIYNFLIEKYFWKNMYDDIAKTYKML